MARYSDAVMWIADNDDMNLGDPEDGIYIVSICLVADLFGKTPEMVFKDVTRRRSIEERRTKAVHKDPRRLLY